MVSTTRRPIQTTTSRLLSTSTSQHATGAGGAAPSRGTEQEDRQLLHAFWISLEVPTAPLKSAMIMSVSGPRSETAMKRRLNQLRSRLPAHVAKRALPSRQKQLQTSRWLELAERCCNPQTRPSGPQQNDQRCRRGQGGARCDRR